jgi:rhodanese-related sulfurtransferase
MTSTKNKMQGSTCIGLFIIMFLWHASAYAATWQWISGAEVQSKMREGSSLWLIDVRSADAYDAVHIEGSVNIPAEALAHKQFPPQKTLILADDALGQRRAREAAEKLAKKGQERVYVLEGGVVGWKLDGFSVAEKEAVVRGVNTDDLKWALAQSVPMRLYDLRDPEERKRGTVQNSESVEGSTLDERMLKVKELLTSGEKSKDLAGRLKRPRPIVLLFPLSADAEDHTRKLLLNARNDIRYVIGGYEAMIADPAQASQAIDSCPTCPGRKPK